MSIHQMAVIFAAGLIAASCSRKPDVDQSNAQSPQRSQADIKLASSQRQQGDVEERRSSAQAEKDSGDGEGETELQPHDDEIAEDCVAFVRATRVVPAQAASADCPACPSQGTEVLRFQSMKIERTFCSATACEIEVTIRASFNPGSGASINGGLTGWISPEQRAQYLQGDTPPDEQVYRVKITYKRAGEAWRAV